MAQMSFTQAKKLVELLQKANPRGDMFVRVLSANKLAIGADPFHPTNVIDLSKELVRPFSLDETNGKASSAENYQAPTDVAAERQISSRY